MKRNGNNSKWTQSVEFVAGIGQIDLLHALRIVIHWPATMSGVTLTLTSGATASATPATINDGGGTSGLTLTVAPGEATAPSDSAKTLQIASLGWTTFTSNDLGDAGEVVFELNR